MRQSNRRLPTIPRRHWRVLPLQWLIIDVSDWLFRLMAINGLWLLLSLTIIGLPPATAALYEVAAEAYAGTAPDPRDYLRRACAGLGRAWGWTAANGIIYGGLFLLGRAASAHDLLLTIIGVVAALGMIAQYYVWAYVALQPQPELLRALRNSLFTALGDLPYVMFYLALTLIVLIPSLILIAPMLLITPMGLALLATYSLTGWLHHRGMLSTEVREL